MVNDQGPSREAQARADFIHMPNNLLGTSCANCDYSKNGVCRYNGEVDLRGLAVNEHTCCNFWDTPGTQRPWQDNTVVNQLVVNTLNGMQPGQQFEVVQLADGRTMYHLIGKVAGENKIIKPAKQPAAGSAQAASDIEEHQSRVGVDNDSGNDQSAPAHRAGAGAAILDDLSTPRRAQQGAAAAFHPSRNANQDVDDDSGGGPKVKVKVELPEQHGQQTSVDNKGQPSGGISSDKACQILHDGEVRGHPITDAQRGMFGAACGHSKGGTHNTRIDNAWWEPEMVDNSMMTYAQVSFNGLTWNDAVSHQGGERLNPDDFAYVPDHDKPSTWKLRIDDAHHVGGAIAALGKGYRGQKVSIPESDRGKVKARIRAAWHKYHGKDEELPEVLRNESEAPVMPQQQAQPPQLTANQMGALTSYQSRWSDSDRLQHFVNHPQDFAGSEPGTFPITNQQDVQDALLLVNQAEDPAGLTGRIWAIAMRKGLLVNGQQHAPQNGEVTVNTRQLQQELADLDRFVANCSCQTTKNTLLQRRSALQAQLTANNPGTGPQWSPLNKEPENMTDDELHAHHSRVQGEIGRRQGGGGGGGGGGMGAAAPLPPGGQDAADQGFTFPGEGSEVSNDGAMHSFDNGGSGGATQAGGTGVPGEYPPDGGYSPGQQNDADRGKSGKGEPLQFPNLRKEGVTGNMRQYHFAAAQPQPQHVTSRSEALLAQAERELASLPVSSTTRALLVNSVKVAREQEIRSKYALVSRMVANVANAQERNFKGNQLMSRSLADLEMMASLLPPVANQQPVMPSYFGQNTPGVVANADQEVPVNDAQTQPIVVNEIYRPNGDGYGASSRLLERLGRK